MDGEQTTALIKAKESFVELPVVLLSSIGCRYSPEELGAKGFAGGLTKPVRQSALYDELLLILAGAGEKSPDVAPVAAGVELAFTGSRVLLVEDNPINQKVATQLLRRVGCAVDVADHGGQAVEKFQIHHYDLILMDVQMPVMDGFEATAQIRRMEAGGRRTTIVAMTANAMAGDRDRCIEAGMDDYLPKPVKPSELSSLLKRWLAGRTEPSAEVERSSREVAWDFESLSATCGGDMEFMREVLEEYVRMRPDAVSKIAGALAAGDWTALIQAAHALKGASRSIGANEVAAVCQHLETFGRAPESGPVPTLEGLQIALDRLQDLMHRYLNRAA